MSTPRTLREGDRGDDVRSLQRKLNSLMRGRIAPIPVTGYFGDITRHAVLGLQREFQLVEDGIVGVRTRAAMNVQVLVVGVAPAPAPSPPQPAPAQPPSPSQPQNRVIHVPPLGPARIHFDPPQSQTNAWTWFALQLQLQGQLQNPGVLSAVLQVMPTLRLRPLPGAYFRARETHIELGLGLGYGISTMTTPTDPRHTVSILAQGALVDPFVWGRVHTQFFAQAGLAINGIPYGSPYSWYLTHYVLQALTGPQVSVDLIPNRWNLFVQLYGGGQYDATSGDASWLYGGALGTGVTF